MTKRLSLLNGLAILAVVCNHAAGWAYTAMVWWADRYRPVSVPNYDQVGSVSYYGLLTVSQLTMFSVPVFLFVSGFFVAYAGRGRSGLGWKTVRVRITHLLIPYLIWSGVIFVGDALQGNIYAPLEYLRRLALGKADVPYFYVLLICQFYLLSPLLVTVAKSRGRLLVAVAAVLQVGASLLHYPLFLGGGIKSPFLAQMAAAPLFLNWSLFFPLGIVAGLRISQFKQWLSRYRWVLFAVTIAFGLLSITEVQLIDHLTGEDWRSHPNMFSARLYELGFVLCFLAFDRVSIRFSKAIDQVRRRAYGIYLVHSKVLEFSARAIRQFAPWMLAHQLLLFMPLLIAVGFGVPLFCLSWLARSPARKAYRYLFG